MSTLVRRLRNHALPDPNDEREVMHAPLLREAADEIERLRAELERERIRLAACGVVALCDTPESAAKTRVMHEDYKSASCDDVARRVDECMRLRNELAAEKQANTELQLALGAKDYDLTEVRGELSAVKALLREVLLYLGHTHYPVSMPTRIRAALGGSE